MATTLASATLALARILGGIKEGVATGGSTTTLIDTNALIEPADFYTGGTLWVTSGTYSGNVAIVKSFSENVVTFQSALAGAIVAGVRYVILPPMFPKFLLVSSINMALSEITMMETDETTLTTLSAESYALPAGVSDVRVVEVATNLTAPYSFKPSYYWKEVDGRIYFLPGKAPSTVGLKIRLFYVTGHPEVTVDTGTGSSIDAQVNLEWLKWAAAVHARRDLITKEGKDDQPRVELLNEAIKNEMQLRNRKVSNRVINRSARLGGW